MSDYLKALKNAKTSMEGIKLKAPGDYRIRVEKTKKQKSWMAKGEVFLCEFEIIKTDPSHAEQLPVGKKASFTINLQKEEALGGLLAFLAAGVGVDPTNEDELDAFRESSAEAFTDAIENNALLGAEIDVSASPRTGRDSGKDYVKLSFRPVQ